MQPETLENTPKKVNSRNKKQKALVVHIGNEKRSKNDRRNQNRGRSVPSAVKMEHYLNLDDAAARVEDGIVHILQQYPDLATESSLVAEHQARQTPVLVGIMDDDVESVSLPVVEQEDDVVAISAARVEQAIATLFPMVEPVSESKLKAIESEDDEPVVKVAATTEVSTETAIAENSETEAIPAETLAEPVPSETDAHKQPETTTFAHQEAVQLAAASGLVLVETSVGAIIAAAARVEPPMPSVLRRSDVPRVSQNVAPVEMIQVETIRE